jgi:Glyoxalase-like domain
MYLGIDHLVIAVADPDVAADELARALGLEAEGGGRHDALGTFNRIVWLGDTYIELIGVFDAGLAGRSWVGAPTLAVLERGGGLATWAIATDAIDADVARLRARGSGLAEPIDGERQRPDGGVVRWRLAASHPLGPDQPPFLIEHDPTAAEWTPDDRAGRTTTAGARLTVLEIAVDDVVAATGQGLRTLDLRFRPSLAGGGARDASIGAQTVRYRARRYPARPGATVHLVAIDPKVRPGSFDLLGCRWAVGA